MKQRNKLKGIIKDKSRNGYKKDSVDQYGQKQFLKSLPKTNTRIVKTDLGKKREIRSHKTL